MPYLGEPNSTAAAPRLNHRDIEFARLASAAGTAEVARTAVGARFHPGRVSRMRTRTTTQLRQRRVGPWATRLRDIQCRCNTDALAIPSDIGVAARAEVLGPPASLPRWVGGLRRYSAPSL